MSPKFLLQTMLLLLLGQVLLGGVGWLLVKAAPWAGLPVTLLLLWFIRRVALIFREEAQAALKREAPILPGRLSLFVALGAQLPGLLLLPYWAPESAMLLWQGAVLPVTATLTWIWEPWGDVLRSFLWLAFLPEVALFAWMAGAPQPAKKAPPAAPPKAAPGEWAPARRVADVERKGRRVR
ncbi:MAG: hypothetical protein ACOY93_05460 [Bacillota bacterium]